MKTNAESIKRALRKCGENVTSVKVTSCTELQLGVNFVECELWYRDEAMDICFIVYCSGDWFSPYDWHGHIPAINEIGEVDWMWGISGHKAIMLQGLPRIVSWEDAFGFNHPLYNLNNEKESECDNR